MDGKEYEAVREKAGFRRLGSGVLSIGGDDRVEFVHNAVTNEVRYLEEGEGVRALYLNPQGRTQNEMRVLETGNSFLVVSETAEEIKETWEGNIFIEDVEIEDEESVVLTVQGPLSEEIVAETLDMESWASDEHDFSTTGFDSGTVYVVRTDSTGEGGFDLLVPESLIEEAETKLENAGATRFTRETHEVLRVEAGIPSFGNEMEDQIPLETGLYDSIDFDKGCYVGQEVIARVEQRGKGPNRNLAGLRFTNGSVEEGLDVFHDGTKVGEVTSVIESPRLGFIGLAYLKTDTLEATDEVVVGLDQIPAEVVETPFDYSVSEDSRSEDGSEEE